MSRTLDRKRSFATVHGETIPWHFEQDGLCFDGQGKQVPGPGGAAPQPIAPPPAAGTDPVAGPVVSDLPPQSPATGALAMLSAAQVVLGKAAEEAIVEVGDASDDMLKVLRELEPSGKNRKTVIAAIDAEIARRESPPPAAPTGIATAQVEQQLGSA